MRLPLIILLLASTILLHPLLADMIVELDLDGQIGNGPDSLYASLGDSLIVDVWIQGDGFGNGFWFFGCVILDNGALDLVEGDILLSLPWTPLPITETGDTVLVSAFAQVPGLPGPLLHAATLIYEVAAESGFGNLDVDLTNSFYMIWNFTARFDNYVGAHITIQGPTGIEESSWGEVKNLFR